MKIFKRIKWSYVVLSVMFLLLGIYLVVNPETSLIMICRILGAAMARTRPWQRRGCGRS